MFFKHSRLMRWPVCLLTVSRLNIYGIFATVGLILVDGILLDAARNVTLVAVKSFPRKIIQEKSNLSL